MAAELEFHIAKLELKPDDILVVKVDGRISYEATKRIKGEFSKLVPNHKCIVVDNGLDLQVLTQSEIKARAA